MQITVRSMDGDKGHSYCILLTFFFDGLVPKDAISDEEEDASDVQCSLGE